MIDTTQAVDRNGNRYCGPLVIAAITGLTSGEAAAKVRTVTGRPIVRGLHTSEIEFTLRALGHKTTRTYPPSPKPTLRKWLEGSRSPFTPYIVALTGHFVIIKGNMFCDTFTKGEWVPLNKAPHMRCRVTTVIQVHNRV